MGFDGGLMGFHGILWWFNGILLDLMVVYYGLMEFNGGFMVLCFYLGFYGSQLIGIYHHLINKDEDMNGQYPPMSSNVVCWKMFHFFHFFPTTFIARGSSNQINDMRIQTSAQRHPRRLGSGVARPLLADLFPCFAKGLSHSHPCSSLQFPHFVHEAQRQKVRRLRVQGREKPRHNRGKPGSGQSVVQNHPALAWDGGVVMST